MELLDVVDQQGNPTGKVVPREQVHAQGLPHHTSHVWILRKKRGKLQILLQKRSDNKDAYPGCYDISSAGHIPAGSDYVPSALRELHEELGVEAAAEDLTYCGQRYIRFDENFHGKPFHDRQYTNVYVLWLNQDAADFTLQQEEVDSVRWFDFDDCLQQVQENAISNCIYVEELAMVWQRIH